MPSQARVFARVMDWGLPDTPVDGKLKLRVEWSLLDEGRENGKFTAEFAEIVNSRALQRDVIDALVDHLNALFPSADYSDRDVLLWGST